MNDEETKLAKRIKELADRSFNNGIYTFTDFLGLAEQNVFYTVLPGLSCSGYELFGGSEDAERRVIRFGSPDELMYEAEFPICCIKVKPLMKKFADELSHRDVLGAVMNLGIERSTIGDISVKEDALYIMCLEKIAGYICENLSRIKRTSVSAEVVEELPEELKPDFAEAVLYCHSLRADGIIAKLFNISRNESSALFEKAMVYINGKTFTKSGVPLKEGDSVSVRGYGKFIYEGECCVTKKGNYRVTIKKYV